MQPHLSYIKKAAEAAFLKYKLAIQDELFSA